jgi:hypothetical protein
VARHPFRLFCHHAAGRRPARNSRCMGLFARFFVFRFSSALHRQHQRHRHRPRLANITGDFGEPGGARAVLARVAIAARRAAALPAMHPASLAPGHGRRPARRPAPGARAAARRHRQRVRLGAWLSHGAIGGLIAPPACWRGRGRVCGKDQKARRLARSIFGPLADRHAPSLARACRCARSALATESSEARQFDCARSASRI